MSDEYDDLSDLKPSEMEQVKEWELQFRFSCFDSLTFTNTLTSALAVAPLT